MTMFVNLHQLPAGIHLYTAYLGTADDPGDEFDFAAHRGLDPDALELVLRANPLFRAGYGTDVAICGIVDQSEGAIIIDRRDQ